MDLEARLIELETKQAFGDDALEQLSDALAHQQREIEELREAVKLLHQQLKAVQNNPGSNAADEPPPPHY
ncbi:SlyX family protein [Motiliproteus sediminis]|uniref:SlyX family protein n=1 Tax=Motiliproteus sediminis TaxID=1468178 RepID=UPI001AEF9C9C|nr:SlyX family protein [Motiliproteus sediminis]